MAVAHRSFSSTTYASRTNTTVTAPAGIQDGDILLLGGVCGAATEAPDPTPPSGFQLVPLTSGTWPIDNSDAGSFNLEFRIYYKAASGESGNYTVTHSTASSQWWMAAYSGGDTGDPIGEARAQGGQSQSSQVATGVTTTEDGSMVVWASHDWGSLSNNLTPPTGTTPTFTERMDTLLCYVADGVMTTAGATGAKSHTNNNDNAVVPYGASLIVINAAPAGEIEQEGYRFRADDGDEDGATWLAAQDTAATIGLDTNFRLRALLNATGDPGSTQYRLDYTEDGTSNWRAIGAGDPTLGIQVVDNANAAITASRSPSVTFGTSPVENDIVVMFPSSTAISATLTMPSGWVNLLGGTTDVESDAHQLCGIYHVVTSAEDSANTTTFTATNLYGATVTGNVVACVVRNVDQGAIIDDANSTFSSTNTATPHVLASLTGANLSTGSLVLSCVVKDSTGAYSTAPTGWTFVNTSNTNQGKALLSMDALTTSGTNVAATNITPSAGDEYASITVAFTAVANPAAINFATSSQYADGDATTAQLTAPSGKTTSDFAAGVMVEGQALADAVDITADDYTEIEWALTAVSGVAVDTDVYDFRVTKAGALLTTYTVTPSITISTVTGPAPARVLATATVGSPSITATATLTPSTVQAVATVGTPTRTATATFTPATVAAVASVGAPSILTGGNPSPITVQAVASVGAPAIRVDRIATPTTVQAVATVGAPVLEVRALPATVAAVVSVGTPTRTATAAVTPTTVTAVATVGASLPSGIRSIAQENALTGYASTNWEISGGGFGSTSIFGFCVEQTVEAGTSAHFKVHCATGWTYKVVRLGYYGGDGARLYDSGTGGAGTTQSNGTLLTAGEGSTGSRDCSNWTNNFTWSVPADATPGFYLLVMDRTSGGRSHARFIVRNANALQADLLYIHPLSTHVAYNAFGTIAAPTGGKSLYGTGTNVFDQATRAWTASTQRPETTRAGVVNTFFAVEYPMVRFIERNGINVDYASDWDIDADPDMLLPYSAVMPVGHDEYWSQGRRDAWDDYLAAGGHAFVVSGNTMLWRVRYTGGNLMHCYKDSHTLDGQSYSGTGSDPVSWTGTWRDTRTGSGAVNDPENRSIGLWFIANGIRNDEFGVDFAHKSEPAWRDCPEVAALTSGQRATFSTDILGFEWDYIRPGHAQNPPSMRAISQSANVDLSSNAANTNGSWYDQTLNPAIHNVVAYRPSGGGLVVNLGVTNWGWAVDATHDLGGSSTPDDDAQQATLNILTDMGAPPTTTMAGLTTPTDHLADWFIEVSPTTVTAVASVGAPSITTGTAPTPARVLAVATVGAPSLTATAQTTPATVAAVATVGAPTVTAAATITPATVAAVATIGTPTRTATASLSPATVVAVATVGTPSVTGGSGGTINPATVQAVATVGAPVVAVSRVATPATVAAVASIGAPALQVVTFVSPTTVAVVATVGAPTVQGGSGATVTPATVAAVAVIGAPTISVPATIAPARVLAVVTVGTPTRLAVTQIGPATVTATTTVGLPTFLATAALAALTVLARAVIGAPTVLVVGLDLPGTSTGTIEVANSSGDIVSAMSTGSIE